MDFEKEQLGEWGIPSFPLGEVARNASPSSRPRARMRSIPLRSAFGIETRDSKGLGFYPDGAFGNEPYLAQAMMGIDVDNNVYSAQVPTTSVYENDIWYEKVNTQE